MYGIDGRMILDFSGFVQLPAAGEEKRASPIPPPGQVTRSKTSHLTDPETPHMPGARERILCYAGLELNVEAQSHIAGGERDMWKEKQSTYEHMQCLMNRLVMAGLAVAGFAVALVVLAGAG
jgi:hypothetical protein